jgi:hypothetical protein
MEQHSTSMPIVQEAGERRDAARAKPVLKHERLADALIDLIEHEARDDVVGAPGDRVMITWIGLLG